MQKDKIRLAIIGCGGMARAHLDAYIHLKNLGINIFDFVAMCDVDLNRAQEFAVTAAESQDGVQPSTYVDVNETVSYTHLTLPTILLV